MVRLPHLLNSCGAFGNCLFSACLSPRWLVEAMMKRPSAAPRQFKWSARCLGMPICRKRFNLEMDVAFVPLSIRHRSSSAQHHVACRFGSNIDTLKKKVNGANICLPNTRALPCQCRLFYSKPRYVVTQYNVY